MEFHDKNLTLEPPAGYECVAVTALGSFLRVAYRKESVTGGEQSIRATNVTEIFLNDAGREVGRTHIQILSAPPALAAPERPPVARRFRFWNGILLALHGLQEMLKCLR